jgi:ATP-dependent RNA helicase RhlE
VIEGIRPRDSGLNYGPNVISPFEHLGLTAQLLRAVQLVGYSGATAVQAATIPAVLAGRDVRARAETGSGKTAAFGLPLLQRLCAQPRRHSARGNPVEVLVLAPTRELVIQIGEVLSDLARDLQPRIKILSVYGGISINPQMMALRGGADILVATPGRALDLHRQHALELHSLRALVLDEADRMLSLGFRDEVGEILALLPAQRQNLLFSATFPPELAPLVQSLLRDPVEVDLVPVATTTSIEQRVYTVEPERKTRLLIHLIERHELRQVLVFVSAKKTGDALVKALNGVQLHAEVFHADKSQAERQRCLTEFRSGHLRVLIATDLAARGIDIEQLPAVINYELPRSPNDYTHRIGRTGRAGHGGLAITLLSPDDSHHFGVIEKRIKQQLIREPDPTRA